MAEGFRFKPTDEEAIEFYLKPKIAIGPQQELPPYIHHTVKEKKLYSAAPWQVFGDECQVFDEKMKKSSIYVFTKLQKKAAAADRGSHTRKRSDGSKEQFTRVAGCGSWVTQTRSKKIKNCNGDTIGIKKVFAFELGKVLEEDHHANMNMGHWIMHEYSVYGVDSDYVLCEIIRYDSKASKEKRVELMSNCGGDDENL